MPGGLLVGCKNCEATSPTVLAMMESMDNAELLEYSNTLDYGFEIDHDPLNPRILLIDARGKRVKAWDIDEALFLLITILDGPFDGQFTITFDDERTAVFSGLELCGLAVSLFVTTQFFEMGGVSSPNESEMCRSSSL